MVFPVGNDNLYTLSFAEDQVIIEREDDGLNFMVDMLEVEWTRNNFNMTKYLTTINYKVLNLGIDEGREIERTDRLMYMIFIPSNCGATKEEITNRLRQRCVSDS